MRLGDWASLLVCLAPALTFASPASAGCPNTCELTAPPITVEPPIACATFKGLPGTCDCDVFVEVNNGCSFAIDALDFQFTSCAAIANSSTRAFQCNAVEANGEAVLDLKIPGTGHHQWIEHVRSNGIDSTVTIAADVTEFNDGSCSRCVASRGASRGIMHPSLLMGLAVAVGLGARRRWRR